MFYGDCIKMCKDFTPNFGDKKTGCCIMSTHRLMLYFLIKLKGRNFDTIEITGAVLKTITKHSFHKVFKKMAEAQGRAYMCGKGLLRG
jgi:hypothetical protein